jgi:hypothetical protein
VGVGVGVGRAGEEMTQRVEGGRLRAEGREVEETRYLNMLWSH